MCPSRIFPKFRADLLECAVVRAAHAGGPDRDTVVPRNPWIAAQQIVAMRQWPASRSERGRAVRVVRRTWTYADWSAASWRTCWTCWTAVSVRAVRELRARIVWTASAARSAPSRRPRAGIAKRGHHPDRGLFTVNLPDGRRVGELDERCLRGAQRAGVLLGPPAGASRRSHGQVVVTRRQARRARAVLHGDGVGRPSELARRSALLALGRRSERRDLQRDYDLDEPAAKNLLQYWPSSRTPPASCRATDDRHRALPRRDRRLELCVLSPTAVACTAPGVP